MTYVIRNKSAVPITLACIGGYFLEPGQTVDMMTACDGMYSKQPEAIERNGELQKLIRAGDVEVLCDEREELRG